MSVGTAGVIGLGAVNLFLIGVLLFRPSLLHVAGGWVLAVLTMLVLPLVVYAVGITEHIERSKQTAFCLSCHVMEPYGQSLQIDSPDYLPAQHFQNARVPKDTACYTCHTRYTMFGDLEAKLAGLRHVYVYYLGQAPAKLALYEPYQNRECLHCHGESRRFNENDLHADMRPDLETNEISCLECHDLGHAIDDLAHLKRWEAAP